MNAAKPLVEQMFFLLKNNTKPAPKPTINKPAPQLVRSNKQAQSNNTINNNNTTPTPISPTPETPSNFNRTSSSFPNYTINNPSTPPISSPPVNSDSVSPYFDVVDWDMLN